MDPNATYNTLRHTVDEAIPYLGSLAEHNDAEDKLDTIVEAFDALDGWLKSGGYLPDAWCKHID